MSDSHSNADAARSLNVTTAHDAHIDRRLRSEPIIWLSTTRPDGQPHLVPVWYLWDGQTILIFSQPEAQKVRNLRHNRQVMLALDTADDGEDVVIIAGTAELLAAGSLDATLPAYAAKYRQLMERIGTTPFQMAGTYTQPIRIRPDRFLPAT